MFSKNVGVADRIIRIMVGVVMLYMFFFTPATSQWHYAWLIGVVPLLTGLFSSCLIYSLFGVSTCATDSK
jgi:hypothetical protein